jgi:uncharacterized protein (DUF433 family)
MSTLLSIASGGVVAARGERPRRLQSKSFNMIISGTVERVANHTDASGVVRVARTRVTLDTIVAMVDGGETAEETALQHPSVPPVAVNPVITYYPRHKAEVGSYLREREQLAAPVRAEAEVEQRSPSAGIRQRLLARRRGGAVR